MIFFGFQAPPGFCGTMVSASISRPLTMASSGPYLLTLFRFLPQRLAPCRKMMTGVCSCE
ncbi:Uncharacterised protein [Segatella copri]|nr:Uncharacterised protein [Segatella copri]